MWYWIIWLIILGFFGAIPICSFLMQRNRSRPDYDGAILFALVFIAAIAVFGVMTSAKYDDAVGRPADLAQYNESIAEMETYLLELQNEDLAHGAEAMQYKQKIADEIHAKNRVISQIHAALRHPLVPFKDTYRAELERYGVAHMVG